MAHETTTCSHAKWRRVDNGRWPIYVSGLKISTKQYVYIKAGSKTKTPPSRPNLTATNKQQPAGLQQGQLHDRLAPPLAVLLQAALLVRQLLVLGAQPVRLQLQLQLAVLPVDARLPGRLVVLVPLLPVAPVGLAQMLVLRPVPHGAGLLGRAAPPLRRLGGGVGGAGRHVRARVAAHGRRGRAGPDAARAAARIGTPPDAAAVVLVAAAGRGRAGTAGGRPVRHILGGARQLPQAVQRQQLADLPLGIAASLLLLRWLLRREDGARPSRRRNGGRRRQQL